MTRIINLRQARKDRARDAKRAEGDANAARFGEAKPLRDARHAEADRSTRVLDAHRRDGNPGTRPDPASGADSDADPGA